ncbi:unnamed protein product [Macrosiphum euphorbiae]|uniref:Uncharacterized protein n=1 Tax=Macrosiphum euphorbiae TaxID=13131 RepID=A0AAV0XXE4_9HEMI|nr:unnamed protein product [Macrosiphum euphorbiae]
MKAASHERLTQYAHKGNSNGERYPTCWSRHELWPVGIRRQLMIRHEVITTGANVGGEHATMNSSRTTENRSMMIGTTSKTNDDNSETQARWRTRPSANTPYLTFITSRVYDL